MSLTQTINYDTPGNFVFDNTKVQVSGSVASLKLGNNTGQLYSQGFASDAGFTYDSAKAEFTGGTLRQLAQRPANSTFGARFSDVIAGNFGDGDLTVTTSGAPSIFDNKLLLSGGSSYVTFDAVGNVAPLSMVGTVRFRFTTNYNGTPVNAQIFLTIGSQNENKIQLFHHNNGAFFVLFNDNTGTNQISSSVSPFSATAGQEIELEMSWDLNAGKVRFFGEGFLVVEMDVSFTRDTTNVDTVQIGDANADFSIRDLVFFSTVQHTANYTAHEYTLPAGDFVESSATLPVFSYPGPGSLQAYTAFVASITGTPRFIFNSKWWNGSAWTTSDGTYAQATSYAAAVTNIGTLPATASLTAKVVFGDGNTRGVIDSLDATYTGQIYPTTNPGIVNSSGVGADDLLDFDATLAASGSDSVRFQIVANGVNKWWNGAAWATSDGTLAQANTAAEVATNAIALDIDSGVTLKLRAVLHSASGATTPTLTSAAIDYDFFAPTPDLPAECIVYGFIRDILGDIEAVSPVLVVTLRRLFIYSDDFVIMPAVKEATADGDGRIELSLVETATASKTYRFAVRYTNDSGHVVTVKLGDATVPNAPSVNLAALTFTT